MRKLIRDKIPEIIESQGRTANITIAGEFDLPVLAWEKVLEELNEVESSKNRDQFIEELGDLYEVLDKYLEVMEITKEEIQNSRDSKNLKNGAFTKNFVLTT